MKAHVVGARVGEVNGYTYGQIWCVEPAKTGNEVGMIPYKLKCDPDVARMITDCDVDYDLELGRYDRVLSVRLLKPVS